MQKNKSILSWLVLSICFLIFISSVIFFVQNKDNETTENLNVTLTDVGFDTPITHKQILRNIQKSYERHLKKTTNDSTNTMPIKI